MKRKLLESLLAQPTAPFREMHVQRLLREVLTQAGVDHFEDPIGNLVVGAKNRQHYGKRLAARSKEPLRLFMAHMDHPGFHGVKWVKRDKLQVRWFGGSPTRHLEGAPVWLADENGWQGTGRLTNVRTLKQGWRIETAEVVGKGNYLNIKQAKKLFGAFHFGKTHWEANRKIYTKCADDLVGVYVIIALALELQKASRRGMRNNFLGLITRAEEVGFLGAVGHFNLGWHQKGKRPLVCVSLETSRTLPGAEFGKGPVVRLGDRATVFHPDYLRILTMVAQKSLRKKFQRRIMDGGTCEATAATAFNIPSVGISVPLGNYHNEGYEGGPKCRGKRGPAPEFVHLDDIEGMHKLCRELLRPKLGWDTPWTAVRTQLQKRVTQSSSLLGI